MDPYVEVEVFQTSDQTKITLGNRPLLIRGLPIGPCVWLWKDVDYLKSRIPEDKRVTVHVCPTSDMNFMKRNFMYKTLSFHSFLHRCTSKEKLAEFFICDDEKYYLRALGNDPRKEAAMFEKHFPELAPDVHIPNIFFKERLFSSVLRGGSAGVRLWTHYDVMDNILMQIVGRKTVVLFDPSDAPYLYLNGDKSAIINVDKPDLYQYPLFASTTRYRASMVPGDILYIPALWFHNVVAEDYSLAVNAFWRSTAINDDYYDTKDVYGNSDLMPAQRAFQGIEKAMSQLEVLPERYRRFYAFRCMDIVKKFCSPRDVYTCSDTSTDSPVMGDYSPAQGRLNSGIRSARSMSTSAKSGGSSAFTHSNLFETYSPFTSESPFHGIAGIGQSHSPNQGPSVSNLMSSVPFCLPGPTSSSATGTYSPLGMTHGGYSPTTYVSNVQSSLPFTVYPNFIKPTQYDFSLPSADELLLPPPHQASKEQKGRSATGISSSGFGFGSQNAAQPQVFPRREKKVLQIFDPSTGEELATFSKLVPQDESIVLVGQGMHATGESETLQYVGISKVEVEEAKSVEEVDNPNRYSYSREIMEEISKLPASKLRPNFPVKGWSSDNMDIVFGPRIPPMPQVKRSNRSGRKPPRFSAGRAESGAQPMAKPTNRKSKSPSSSGFGNRRSSAKKNSFPDQPSTESGVKAESKAPPEGDRTAELVDDGGNCRIEGIGVD